MEETQRVYEELLQSTGSLFWSYQHQGSIPTDVFKFQNTIYNLYFQGNALDCLPDQIGLMRELRVLTLNENKLSKLPSTFPQLLNLRWLEIRDNRLKELPDDFHNLINLEHLDLSQNIIDKLPPDIGKLKRLAFLNLASNHLKDLPDSLAFLERCQNLDLSHNRFSRFPSSILSLKNLQLLNLSHNYLKHIPDAIGRLDAIRNLMLSHNFLTMLPSSIASGLMQLIHLDVSFNDLRNLPIVPFQNASCQCNIQGNENISYLPFLFGSQQTLAGHGFDPDSSSADFVPKFTIASDAAFEGDRRSLYEDSIALIHKDKTYFMSKRVNPSLSRENIFDNHGFSTRCVPSLLEILLRFIHEYCWPNSTSKTRINKTYLTMFTRLKQDSMGKVRLRTFVQPLPKLMQDKLILDGPSAYCVQMDCSNVMFTSCVFLYILVDLLESNFRDVRQGLSELTFCSFTCAKRFVTACQDPFRQRILKYSHMQI